jgi:hypothetical protein
VDAGSLVNELVEEKERGLINHQGFTARVQFLVAAGRRDEPGSIARGAAGRAFKDGKGLGRLAAFLSL